MKSHFEKLVQNFKLKRVGRTPKDHQLTPEQTDGDAGYVSRTSTSAISTLETPSGQSIPVTLATLCCGI